MEPELPLRDIHLPSPISWWPPAPGWWLLAFIFFILICGSIWLWRRQRRNRAIRKLALAELTTIEQSGGMASLQLGNLATLIRRVCLSTYPRSDVAGLTGDAWLAFLDRQLGGNQFSEGIGRLLAHGPYRPLLNEDLQPLFSLCRQWLKALPAPANPRRGYFL